MNLPMWAMVVAGFSLSLHLGIAGLAAPQLPDAASADQRAFLAGATAALSRGDLTNAIELATKAIVGDTANTAGYATRALIYEKAGQHAKAIADYSELLKRQPDAAAYYQRRGVEHFRLAHFKQAIADFDKFIELKSDAEPQHWQRGIAYYYAGEFEKGRRQFKLHQTVNPHDVENAVWHFLCVARLDGIDKARASLIPIENDSRVPMKEVHQFYAGKATPGDVLAAAQAGKPPVEQLRRQLFYAHLYLGLYYEVLGETNKVRQNFSKAAREFGNSDYMGDVARVHWEQMEERSESKRAAAP
jgi:lipoprotein NlpI